MAEQLAELNKGNNLKIYEAGNATINKDNYVIIGTLPAEYQGAKAYLVTADANGAYLTGGVNVGSYDIYGYNNYTGVASLTFNGIKVVCIF